MSSDTTILAFTPANGEAIPPYFNIKVIDEDFARVTVRGSGYTAVGHHYSGGTSTIDIPIDILEQLLADAYRMMKND